MYVEGDSHLNGTMSTGQTERLPVGFDGPKIIASEPETAEKDSARAKTRLEVRALWALTVAEVVIIAANALTWAWGGIARDATGIHADILRLASADEEQSFQTMFSITQLLAVGLIGVLVTLALRHARKAEWKGWMLFSGVVLFLATDEQVGMHDALVFPMRRLLDKDTLGPFYFAWVIPGIAVVILGAFMLKGFAQSLPRQTRRFLILAAVIYFSGAIGGEMLSGWVRESSTYSNGRYISLMLFEESCEMFGVTVAVYGLLQFVLRGEGRNAVSKWVRSAL